MKNWGKYRRRRLRVAAACVLLPVSVFVLGYALTGRETAPTTAAVGEGVSSPGSQSAPSKQPAMEQRATAAGTEAGPLPAPGSCDDPLVLVDRENPLPADYVPKDMIRLDSYGVPTTGGAVMLRREAAGQLDRLVEAANVAGEELVVASSYRSFQDQQASYSRWVGFYGGGAGGMSAPPGHSEHQLGTTVDFTNAAADYRLWWGFGDTAASEWLMEHAWEYGFVLSYPKGEEEGTGYQWEPWHYRFIGVENTRLMKQSGLNLREFLMREGVRPGCG